MRRRRRRRRWRWMRINIIGRVDEEEAGGNGKWRKAEVWKGEDQQFNYEIDSSSNNGKKNKPSCISMLT